MSNAAKFEIPGVGDAGKGYIYDEANDEFDLSATALATQGGTETLTNKTITTPVITLEQGASVAPTAEGRIAWDTDDNRLKVGDGAGTKTFSDDSVNAATYQAILSGASLSDVGTPAPGDLILLQDASDASNLKVAQFSTFGGGGSSSLLEDSLIAGKLSGAYYSIVHFGTVQTSSGLTQSRLYYLPILLRAGTIDRLAVRCVATAASNVARVGLYASDGTTLLPTGAALADQSLSLSAATGLVEATVSISIATTGRYYLGYAQQGGATATVSAAVSSSQHGPFDAIAHGARDILASSLGIGAWYEDSVTGALPTVGSLTEQAPSTNVPLVWVRYA